MCTKLSSLFVSTNTSTSSRCSPACPRQVRKLGMELLHDPWYNQGTAFSPAERERLRLRGLLPPRHLTIDTQMQRLLHELEHGAESISANVSWVSWLRGAEIAV